LTKIQRMPMSPIGPSNSLVNPRFANISTFAHLPRIDQLETGCDIAIVGAPFDAGVSYRPGARFGPQGIRAGSQLLRPFDPALGISPFDLVQVADCGDLAINPFALDVAIEQIYSGAQQLLATSPRLMVLGGDHTITLPLLRAAHEIYGPLAVVHFDSHLDTWDTYFGAPYTHGTPFRRAYEDGLLAPKACSHIGTRGPLYGVDDLTDDASFGFEITSADTLDAKGSENIAEQVRARCADYKVYLSLDIDVLDPAYAPGTGTPEAGGPSSGDILRLLRALRGLPIVGCDVVEVSPAYDHAEVTSIAASHIAYTMIGLMAENLSS